MAIMGSSALQAGGSIFSGIMGKSAAKKQAEVETTAHMRQLFRAKVQDPNALSDDAPDASARPDLMHP